ncbi:hypothetical protein BDB00DRAFT_835925 [Zychaea mexicana]|uniref:uncharacterized protein n=1 Tax=Zychaea mexicana TaxID=64656 RepID=UPI0022FF33B4|nr:uncharacterized protein BDB00DRAFT_835925 [Zychaea mexicana]KAI9490911.1 hypothetical protein BDB00DRAFT_835925 [Zychaea mexicana]
MLVDHSWVSGDDVLTHPHLVLFSTGYHSSPPPHPTKNPSLTLFNMLSLSECHFLLLIKA